MTMEAETEITTTFVDSDPTYNDELREIIGQIGEIKVQESSIASSVSDISVLYADYRNTSDERFLFLGAVIVFIVAALGTICGLLISHFFGGR